MRDFRFVLAKKTVLFGFFGGVFGSFYFVFLVCQHPAAWDRSAVTHCSAAQVRGYSGTGLDKLDCAGIPLGPFKREREREAIWREVPSICRPSCQTLNDFAEQKLPFFNAWISGVLWLLVCVSRETCERAWKEVNKRREYIMYTKDKEWCWMLRCTPMINTYWDIWCHVTKLDFYSDWVDTNDSQGEI